MRLLAVIHYPVFGGPHNQVLRLAGPLEAHGISTVVLLPDEPGNAVVRLRTAGVPVITMPLHRLRKTRRLGSHLALAARFPREVLSIRRLIQHERIDIVQIGGLLNPHGAVAARLAHRPVVWQLLDVAVPKLVLAAGMGLVRAMGSVVMTAGTAVAEAHPFAAGLRTLVPFFPPVDTDLFRPRTDFRARIRMRWNIPQGAPVVGCVANVNPQKAIVELVEVFASVRRQLPASCLVLIGAEHETHRDYSALLRARISALGIRDAVIIHGESANLHELLPGIDVVTLASRNEGTPTVLMEAMACGVPVVATDVGGVSDVVVDGVTGFLVPPSDQRAFASALVSLLSDPAVASRMGAAGRARAIAKFSVERSLEAHLRAYALATAGPNARRA